MSQNRPNTTHDLRERAEALLARSPEAFQPEDIKNVNKLAHELAVHQAELELQNEELRNTQNALQKARDRYAALFEDAPVGYVVLDTSGIIRQTNATWRTMLGRPDKDFRGTAFATTLLEEDAPVFLSRFRAFFRNPAEKQIVVRIKRGNSASFYGQIEARPRESESGPEDNGASAKELMVIVSDVTERIRAEVGLRASEELHRTTLASIGDAVISTDARGNVKTMNIVAEQLTGWKSEEASGKPLTDVFRIINSHTRQGVDNPVGKVLASGKIVGLANHTLLIARDGTERQIADSAAPIRDDWQKVIGVVLVFRDVTEEYAAAERLRQSEELLDATGRMARVGGWELDTRTGELAWTKATYDIHDVPLENKPPLNEAIEFFHPDDRPTLEQALQDATEKATPYDLELRFITAKGRNLVTRTQCTPVVEDGNVVMLRGTFQDITELRRAEEDLAAIFNMSLAMICVADIQTTTFIRVNPAFTTNLGYQQEELCSYSFLDFVHSDDLEETQQMVKNSLLQGEMVSSFENRIRHKDGSFRWLLWSFHPRPELGLTFATAIDITEQKNLQDRLRQMEKMDAIGQLAGGVAHDFNNQLTCIMGYADILLGGLEEPERRRYADNILVATRRAGDLTQKLLAFARKGQYESVPVDIHAMVQEVVEILTYSIDKRIEIKQRLTASPSTTKGDPGQIQNALLNLGINASDAMQDGGKLVFETRITELDDEYCSGTPYEILPGPYLSISISDTGCGIAREDLARIFEPFFTTKEVGKGTGMGLAAVYGTVKQHGGAINVYSEVGRGTTFRIYLPVEEKAAALLNRNTDVITAPFAATILVVDDERVVRHLTEDMLTSLGYAVKTRNDGAAGLAFFEKHWREIDLVILDMIMPRMNGSETYRAMKAMNPDVKVLLVSGYSLDGAAQTLLADGVKGFIQKPFDRFELSTKVVKALQEGTD